MPERRDEAFLSGDPTDEYLMLAFQNGDNKAFDGLYRRYWPALTAYFKCRLGGVYGDIAEDLADDVFEKVLRRPGQFDPARGLFRNWLYGIAHKHRLGLRRKTDIFFRAVATSVHENMPESLNDRATDAHEKLGPLPPKLRRVIELLFFDELRPIDVAQVLGISCPTVYRRKSIALRFLRRKELTACDVDKTDSSHIHLNTKVTKETL